MKNRILVSARTKELRRIRKLLLEQDDSKQMHYKFEDGVWWVHSFYVEDKKNIFYKTISNDLCGKTI